MANKFDVIARLKLGMSPNEIAAELGCLPAYVRAVRQRETEAGRKRAAEWCRKYRQCPVRGDKLRERRNEANARRYHEDPEYRERMRSYNAKYRRKRYREDPEFRARVLRQTAEWQRRKRLSAQRSAQVVTERNQLEAVE